jgi:hypothetical protein
MRDSTEELCDLLVYRHNGAEVAAGQLGEIESMFICFTDTTVVLIG